MNLTTPLQVVAASGPPPHGLPWVRVGVRVKGKVKVKGKDKGKIKG